MCKLKDRPSRLNMNRSDRRIIAVKVALIVLTGVIAAGSFGNAGTLSSAQTPIDSTIARVPNPPLASDLVELPGDLRAIPGPEPPNLAEFVRDVEVARALGKAFFWVMQFGSDGVQSCASCHFVAGADPRSKNQISPGLTRVPGADLTYSTNTGPNHQPGPSDFPLPRLAIPGVRGSLDAATDS